MDIIKYGNLYKEEKKVKAKCPYCGTKVVMTKSDYKLFDYQTNLLWTCPFCEKEVITKRFNIYRTWDKIISWFKNHIFIVMIILISCILVGATIILPIALAVINSGPDDTDKYFIDYHYEGFRHEEYVDDYKLEGGTLYTWDDGEKTQYNSVVFNKVTTLKEEE